jgi:UDP-2,3-diacylglucosamine pyrophosphatase LpxH
MPSIQILSDIHLEHRDQNLLTDACFSTFVEPAAQILCLIGDIGSPYQQSFVDFVRWCSERWELVLFVAGNHDFFSHLGETCEVMAARMAAVCARHSNVRMLHNETLRVDDCLFIGSTLWSHVPDQHAAELAVSLTSFHYIFTAPGVPVTVAQNNAEHSKCAGFIARAVTEAVQQKLKPVVLTHYVPSMDCTSHPRFDAGNSKYGFSTQLSSAHAPGTIHLWAAGHTHYNFSHSREGYRLVSNQYGYGKQPMPRYRTDHSIQL